MELALALETLVLAYPFSFLAGVVVGLACSSRWRIVRRNGG